MLLLLFLSLIAVVACAWLAATLEHLVIPMILNHLSFKKGVWTLFLTIFLS
jgi:hypothetical protein